MNIIILGPQGSGKGTQAAKIADKFRLDIFDAGRALREVAKMQTPLGKEVHEIIMVKKELVPSRILREVLHFRISSLGREQGVIFDGVPRNLEQAKYMEEAMLEFGREINKVFYINISEEESYKRISKRWVCEKCKAVFIMGQDIDSADDPCPLCDGRITQREDDTIEGIAKRLKIFAEETLPVINYFKEKDLLCEINGEREAEKVFSEIIHNINQE